MSWRQLVPSFVEFFRGGRAQLNPILKNRYRYDWEYGYWEWRRIGGYTRDEQGVIRWRGVPIPQHKHTGPTDEPTR